MHSFAPFHAFFHLGFQNLFTAPRRFLRSPLEGVRVLCAGWGVSGPGLFSFTSLCGRFWLPSLLHAPVSSIVALRMLVGIGSALSRLLPPALASAVLPSDRIVAAFHVFSCFLMFSHVFSCFLMFSQLFRGVESCDSCCGSRVAPFS